MNLNIRTPPIPTGEVRGKLKILYRLHNVLGHFYLCQCLNCGALVEADLKVLHPSKTICNEWKSNFVMFYDWAILLKKPLRKELINVLSFGSP